MLAFILRLIHQISLISQTITVESTDKLVSTSRYCYDLMHWTYDIIDEAHVYHIRYRRIIETHQRWSKLCVLHEKWSMGEVTPHFKTINKSKNLKYGQFHSNSSLFLLIAQFNTKIIWLIRKGNIWNIHKCSQLLWNLGTFAWEIVDFAMFWNNQHFFWITPFKYYEKLALAWLIGK